MRGRICLVFIFFMAALSARSQYFFKDIILTKHTRENWILFHHLKVHAANIESIDANDQPMPGFTCTQTISPDFSKIITFTKSADVPASSLFANYDQNGFLLKTTDTSDTFKATTEYTYNDKGQVSSLLNISQETDNHIAASEKHIWLYRDGNPKQMIKIKENTDTTYVNLTLDEKGNVIEEKSIHGQQTLPSVYYYYDNENRLTDIVRYNEKAARLLPDYVFEYKYDRISSMLFVPTGSNDYQKWVYSYDSSGLKKNESCFDKKKNLIVKINYTYNFQ